MYENPVLFPQVTNRESWRQILQLADDDTGDLITLTDGNGNSLYTITLAVEPARPRGGTGGYGDGSAYDGDACAALILQTLSAGSGVTSNPALSILDTGTVQIFIPKAQMQTLRGARTFDVFMTVYESDIDDGRQLFCGRLPVIYGGRNT